jgi:RNA polymerase sigma-70 factor (ECF subfamily)
MIPPETRNSLLVRLRDPADADAWHQFSEVYRPIILRMAVAKGLQRADAEDLAQKVLVSIAGAIERWEPNGQAKFRTWLKRITDNAVLNALTRRKPDRAGGGEEIQSVLNEQPDRTSPDSELLKMEYHREIMHWAARKIRDEFSETTWRAFWLTAIENRSAEEISGLIGRNRGSIYAAKSRVMRRLIEKVREFSELEEQE